MPKQKCIILFSILLALCITSIVIIYLRWYNVPNTVNEAVTWIDSGHTLRIRHERARKVVHTLSHDEIVDALHEKESLSDGEKLLVIMLSDDVRVRSHLEHIAQEAGSFGSLARSALDR